MQGQLTGKQGEMKGNEGEGNKNKGCEEGMKGHTWNMKWAYRENDNKPLVLQTRSSRRKLSRQHVNRSWGMLRGSNDLAVFAREAKLK